MRLLFLIDEDDLGAFHYARSNNGYALTTIVVLECIVMSVPRTRARPTHMHCLCREDKLTEEIRKIMNCSLA